MDKDEQMHTCTDGLRDCQMEKDNNNGRRNGNTGRRMTDGWTD